MCPERFTELAAELAFLQREEDAATREVIYIQSRSTSPAAVSTTPKETPTAVIIEATPTAKYYCLQERPHRVYKEYRKSREAWFDLQPPGASLTDRAYRESARLPLEHDTGWYQWCRMPNQMGPFVKLQSSKRLRDWTTEEMNSWIDAEFKANSAADEQESELLEAEGPGYAAR